MESSLRAGELLDEKYLIDAPLGQGGMGSVYRATHVGTKRTVALKVIRPQYTGDEEFVQRFRREAEAAGRLRHPNVVDVTDFGFATAAGGQVAYLVMEYLDGCTLAEVLEEEARLPVPWAVDILEQVCLAVDQAHRQGIIHRDLKPDNIWLEPNRRGGYTVKVLDFGLAKLDGPIATAGVRSSAEIARAPRPNETVKPFAARPTLKSPDGASEGSMDLETLVQPPPDGEDRRPMDAYQPHSGPETDTRIDVATKVLPTPLTAAEPRAETFGTAALTRVGSVMGTPLYMSPEQCRGEALDARSDIYSLGVIAYRMLSGATPFTGTFDELVKLHSSADPKPIRELNRKLSRRAGDLIMSALAKGPEQRPQSAAGFASALRARTEGTGVVLRQAFSLYSEQFPTFFKISLLAYAPLALFLVFQLIMDKINDSNSMLVNLSLFFGGFLGGHLLAYSFISASTAPIVTQLKTAPLKPPSVRMAFRSFKRCWVTFLAALFAVVGLIFVVTALFTVGIGALVVNYSHYAAKIPHALYPLILGSLTVPGLAIAIRYSLFAPVAVSERLGVVKTLKRASALMKRAPASVIFIALLQLLVPVLVFMAFNGHTFNLTIEEHQVGVNFTLGVENNFNQLLNVLVAPLTAIMAALVYLRARGAGGEVLEDDYEDLLASDGAPHSKWQSKMNRTREISR